MCRQIGKAGAKPPMNNMRTSLKNGLIFFVIGALFGAGSCWFLYRNTVSDYVIDCVSGKVIDLVTVLRLTRQGSTERLINEKEDDLSAYIFELSQNKGKPSEREVKFLLAAERYYQEYPINSSDKERDAIVKAFLEKVKADYGDMNVSALTFDTE
jgi:hypothetical protein